MIFVDTGEERGEVRVRGEVRAENEVLASDCRAGVRVSWWGEGLGEEDGRSSGSGESRAGVRAAR